MKVISQEYGCGKDGLFSRFQRDSVNPGNRFAQDRSWMAQSVVALLYTGISALKIKELDNLQAPQAEFFVGKITFYGEQLQIFSEQTWFFSGKICRYRIIN